VKLLSEAQVTSYNLFNYIVQAGVHVAQALGFSTYLCEELYEYSFKKHCHMHRVSHHDLSH